jgi:hypothetical protein
MVSERFFRVEAVQFYWEVKLMKTGLSKKLISVILSILLVITAIPMTVFADIDGIDGLDGTDANSAKLLTAMNAYTDKMDGTVYTNMYAAYSAYLQASQAYDAYVYGDVDIDLDAYADALTTATSNMTEYKGYSGTATSASDGSYKTSTLVESDEMSNVLYTYGMGNNATYASSTNDSQFVGLQYGAITFLYNGGTMACPVNMFVNSTSTTGTHRTRSLRPYKQGTTDDSTSATIFSLSKVWHGKSTTTGYQTVTSGDMYTFLGYEDGDTDHTSQKSNKTQYYYSNTLYCSAALDSSTYLKEYNITWYTLTNNGKGSTIAMDSTATNNTVGPTVRVINYKVLKDKIDSLSIVSDAENYKDKSSLAAYYKTIDSATFDPNSYFTSSNNYSDCKTAIENAVTNLGNLTAPDSDTTGYDALRTAITGARNTYNSTDETKAKYTSDSWSAFASAYEAAKAVMVGLVGSDKTVSSGTGYNDPDNAQTLADTLNAKFAALEVEFTSADTAKLEEVIGGCETAIENSTYYTTDSYTNANLEENVLNAKVAVWGAEDQYQVTANCLSSDDQDTVDSWYKTLDTAIMSLEVSKDAIVTSARSYSMNSAIEYAKSLSASDYSNYSAVQQAIDDCSSFVPTLQDRETGAVSAKISSYKSLVEALVYAINNLHSAFSKLANGEVANAGETVDTTLSYSKFTMTLTWSRKSGQIFFRTSNDVSVFDIGQSNFTFYANANYDQYLQTINFSADSNFDTKEITANNDLTSSSYSISNFAGNLGAKVTTPSATYKWKNFYVTSNTGSYACMDSNGTGYSVSDNFKMDDELLVAQADYDDPSSGILCKSGSTYFVADGTLNLPEQDEKDLSAETVPTSNDYKVSTNLGTYINYKYHPTGIYDYRGFGTISNSYTQSATVIDITTLIDLINTVDSLSYLDYTADTWDDVETALTAAKSEMDYTNMTAAQILAECKTRYNDLWTAYSNLAKPLSNKEIADAVSSAIDVYNATNDSNIYSADSWSAFETAYKAAYNSIYSTDDSVAIYSTKNIRNIDNNTTNAAAITKLATDLTTAFNALVKVADFTKLIAAANTSLESYVYTVSDLNALADVINSSKYLKYTVEEQSATYEDEQDAIDAETSTIADAFAALQTTSPIDTSALEGVKADLVAKIDDPDAWTGLDEAKEYIDSFTDSDKLYTAVKIYNASVYGINYTQSNTDAIVTEAMTKIQPQTYDVTVIDQNGETKVYEDVPYGATQEVTSLDGSNVDWYYSYKSNTSENTEKYYTTDSIIRFVVKGDTTLRTEPNTNTDTSQYKVTVVSALKSKVLNISYVNSGDSYTLPEPTPYAYYDFTGYTVNGETKQAGDKITPTANTTITANYEMNDDADVTITLVMRDVDDSWTDSDFEAKYNDLVEVKQSSLVTEKKATKASIVVAGETQTSTVKGFRRSEDDNKDIYAYALIPYTFNGVDNVDSYDNLIDGLITKDVLDDDGNGYHHVYNPSEDGYSLLDTATIVGYGQDYSFYAAEDSYLVALSEEDYEDFVNSGVATVDDKGADVATSSQLSESTSELSIVSTYALPEGATFVESGILFTKDTSADLKLSNVDSKSIYRFKSSAHTVGNQFVISIKKPSKSTSFNYLAYMIYEIDGVQYRVESDVVNATYEA